MLRIGWTLLVAVAVLALLPSVCGAWGTISEPLPMSADEDSKLRRLINLYGANKEESLGEIEPRRGPHATHQFIVRQAYLLLERDPAFKESPWKLPEVNSVLAWDGVVRQTAGLDGMVERKRVGSGPAAILAPAKGEVGGPSADAEITASVTCPLASHAARVIFGFAACSLNQRSAHRDSCFSSASPSATMSACLAQTVSAM